MFYAASSMLFFGAFVTYSYILQSSARAYNSIECRAPSTRRLIIGPEYCWYPGTVGTPPGVYCWYSGVLLVLRSNVRARRNYSDYVSPEYCSYSFGITLEPSDHFDSTVYYFKAFWPHAHHIGNLVRSQLFNLKIQSSCFKKYSIIFGKVSVCFANYHFILNVSTRTEGYNFIFCITFICILETGKYRFKQISN